jgi:hypothetical protein
MVIYKICVFGADRKSNMAARALAYWFQRRRFLKIFPIGSYVKTMFADGCHLGWRSGSQDIILKVDHLRTIRAMFACVLIGRNFKNLLVRNH